MNEPGKSSNGESHFCGFNDVGLECDGSDEEEYGEEICSIFKNEINK